MDISRGQWTEEDEKKHPRGTGDKGGQFVSKEESNAQQWSKQRAEERKADEARQPVTKFKPWTPAEKKTTKTTHSSGGGRSSGGHSRGKGGKGGGSSKSKSSLGKGPLGMGEDNDPAQVKELQSLLHDLGLFGGKPNGNYDRFTERAVMEAQRKLGVKKPNGKASSALIHKLMAAKALSPCIDRSRYADDEDIIRAEYPNLCDALDAGELDEDVPLIRASAEWAELQSRIKLAVIARTAGVDVTPGHDRLHHWWVYGEGRARWRTWTELRDQLLEHVSPAKAERFASEWFHERYGYWSGSDLNRVKHGKPPRGDRVGPG